jgi:hypothetical protein
VVVAYVLTARMPQKPSDLKRRGAEPAAGTPAPAGAG